jgi:hypothetical protein
MTNQEAIKYFKDATIDYSHGAGAGFKAEQVRKHVIESLEENDKFKEIQNKYGLLLEMYDKKQTEISRLQSELSQSIKLPCKVGDTIYEIHKLTGRITEIEIGSFIIFQTPKELCVFAVDAKCRKYFLNSKNFGKTVFLTEAAAEQALRESVSE